MKKTSTFLFVCIFLSAAILSLHVYPYFVLLQNNDSGTIYDLTAGTSKKKFIRVLCERGALPNPLLFTLYVYLHPFSQLKTGEYFFAKGTSLQGVWQAVTQGQHRYYRAFTLVPGWSFKQLKTALTQAVNLKLQWITLSNEALMQTLGKGNEVPEGLFFPDTYYYTKGDSDKVILQKAFQLLQNSLANAWEHRDPNLPYTTPYQALIVASLIEKEAHLVTEYNRIAGVILNRLRAHMFLQLDPTVIYALGDHYDGKINKSDLQYQALHNTYVYKGLPPTPIAMVSLKALEAAVHPETHDYYYFVARGDGSHIFSKTLAEHNQAVKEVASKKAPVVSILLHP